jgi:hypothetical protein
MQRIQQLAVGLEEEDYPACRGMVATAQGIGHQLQAKYAASLISSTTQLRLLSCSRSAAVAQPAMGWLRMHEPL